LNDKSGEFKCVLRSSDELVFKKGAIKHEPGKYHLSYDDGTPFFWLACTAWNGALQSTLEEWNYYLE
jgi:hypothetical protein